MARRKRKSGPGGARPGAGRKRVYEDLIYRTIGFERATFEKLVRAAQKRGESVAAIVRRAVDTYLRRQKPWAFRTGWSLVMAERLAYPLKDFARAVGVSPNTARKWIKTGLQCYRVGGLVLILPTDFETWLRAHREPPESLDPVREEARWRVNEQQQRRA